MKRLRALVRLAAAAGLAAATLGGCKQQESGPIRISAIGGSPRLANPNREPLDPASALLVETTAEGLVRFESSGQVEPALAQRWILSDDGLRYTFRLAPAEWSGGGQATATEVVARLKAAAGPTSRNPLKPLLGAVEEIVAMTDDVLEISLKAPRPHFLELLAHPELGIIRDGQGTGPYRVARAADGEMILTWRESRHDQDAANRQSILLRGETAGMAIARFQTAGSDFVTGGTLGDLPIARAAGPVLPRLQFDPVAGLLGFAFVHREGPLADPEVRSALAMAIDRDALVAALAVPNLVPRVTLVPQGTGDLPTPIAPAWNGKSLAERRVEAARAIGSLPALPLIVRISIPEGPGYRMLFARVQSDWRAIGVDARSIRDETEADLRLVDAVAPAMMATWYLRHFSCQASRICSPEADEALEEARITQNIKQRRERLAAADRYLSDQVPFIAIAAPVRWYLVAERLTGFRANSSGRHAVDQLVAAAR